MKPKKMSQRERTAKHREEHPESEAMRKERQRRKEELCLIHIKRFVLSDIEIPDDIDQSSGAFKRALARYEEIRAQKVEVEVSQ